MSGDDLRSRADRLAGRFDEPAPEAWKPERRGDQVVGVFRGLEGPKHDRFRGEVFVAVLEDPDTQKRMSVWLLHTALANEMKRKRPQVGDLVAIRYLGKHQPKGGGSAYDNYRVEVDRDSVDGNVWELIGDGDPAAPAAAESPVGPSELGAAGAPGGAQPAAEVCFECHEDPTAHAPWCSLG